MSILKTLVQAPGSTSKYELESLRKDWSNEIYPRLNEALGHFEKISGFAVRPTGFAVLGVAKDSTKSFHPDLGYYRMEINMIIEAQWDHHPVQAPQNAFMALFVTPELVQSFQFRFTLKIGRSSACPSSDATQAELIHHYHYAPSNEGIEPADYFLPPFGSEVLA